MRAVAILCGDIHLCHTAPLARGGEPDWYEAMARPLRWLRAVADTTGAPIVYAGDIFDRWYAPARLISWAIDNLPPGYAIPGQHDLPQHNYDDRDSTGYGILCKAGVLQDLPPGRCYPVPVRDGLVLYGYPWGHDIAACPDYVDDRVHIAVSHRFVYRDKATGYTGAPKGGQVGRHSPGGGRSLRGVCDTYDIAHFGDNHKPFIEGNIVNTGGFYRRTIAEVSHEPGVVVVMENGTTARVTYETDKEVMATPVEMAEWCEVVLNTTSLDAMSRQLFELGRDPDMDFMVALRRAAMAPGVDPGVRARVLEAAGA